MMFGTTAPRAVAAAALRFLLLSHSVSSSAVQVPRAGGALEVWVSVNPSGVAATITPSVTTINGVASTISGAPDAVTRTSVYTLTTASGQVVTTTGAAPVASATGSGEAGAFVVCAMYQGIDEPFCQPKRGSLLNPGHTYFITWDPSWFEEDTMVQAQGSYNNGSGIGFTSDSIAASAGFYAWTIDKDFITQHNNEDTSVELSLLYTNPSDSAGKENSVVGPSVTVSITQTDSHSGSSHSTLVIALPIVTVLIALSVVALLVWSRIRHGSFFGFANKSRSSEGYGVRQSRSQRVGGPAPVDTDKGRGIQLTDRESWSPTQGRNVFREELQRQERDGA